MITPSAELDVPKLLAVGQWPNKSLTMQIGASYSDNHFGNM